MTWNTFLNIFCGALLICAAIAVVAVLVVYP